MAPSAIAAIQVSAALLASRAEALDAMFAVALRARAPSLAGAAEPGLARAIVAVLAAGGTADGPADLDRLLRDARSGPRASAAVGLALLATLAHALGPAFDDAVQAAWSEAYVELVRRLMAARWNRMDLVA